MKPENLKAIESKKSLKEKLDDIKESLNVQQQHVLREDPGQDETEGMQFEAGVRC